MTHALEAVMHIAHGANEFYVSISITHIISQLLTLKGIPFNCYSIHIGLPP